MVAPPARHHFHHFQKNNKKTFPVEICVQPAIIKPPLHASFWLLRDARHFDRASTEVNNVPVLKSSAKIFSIEFARYQITLHSTVPCYIYLQFNALIIPWMRKLKREIGC